MHIKKKVFLLIFFSLLWTAPQGSAKDNVLRVGLLRPPLTLNFFGAGDIWSKRILSLFHMPLYIHAPLSGEMLPWIAESLPEIKNGGKQIIIKLRDAKWEDGSPISGDDLRYTFRIIRKYQIPGHYEKWIMVQNISGEGKEIRFELKYPSSIFLNRTLYSPFIQRRHWEKIIKERDAKKASFRNISSIKIDSLMSNGPFTLNKYKSPFYLVVKVNPNFVLKDKSISNIHIGPFIKAIIFKYYRNTEEILGALRDDQIDFLWWNIPDDRIKELQMRKEIRIFSTPRRGYDYLGFNLRKKPFKLKTLRKAIAIIIQRKAFFNKPSTRKGIPVYSFMPPYNTFWNCLDFIPPWEALTHNERLQKARLLLKEAGFTWVGKDIFFPDGKRIPEIELLTTCAGCKPFRFKSALQIKNWCNELGIRVRISMKPIDIVLKRLRQGNFDMYLLGWSHLPDDPGYLETFFHSRETKRGGKNYPGFKNPEFDRLCELSNKEIDPLKRRELLFKMQRILFEESPCIPLYSRNRMEAINQKHFSGWIPLPGGIGNIWSFLTVKAN